MCLSLYKLVVRVEEESKVVEGCGNRTEGSEGGTERHFLKRFVSFIVWSMLTYTGFR